MRTGWLLLVLLLAAAGCSDPVNPNRVHRFSSVPVRFLGVRHGYVEFIMPARMSHDSLIIDIEGDGQMSAFLGGVDLMAVLDTATSTVLQWHGTYDSDSLVFRTYQGGSVGISVTADTLAGFATLFLQGYDPHTYPGHSRPGLWRVERP